MLSTEKCRCARASGVANQRGIEDLRAVHSACAAVVDANRCRHTVTELPSVLGVVDAYDTVITADQKGRVVARETMPWRAECRGGFTDDRPLNKNSGSTKPAWSVEND